MCRKGLFLSCWLSAWMVLPIVRTAPGEGWKMPNLNPFSKKEDSGESYSARSRKEASESWTLPSLPKLPTPKLPGWSSSQSGASSSAGMRRSEPSTWDRVASAPKQMWQKTKETFSFQSEASGSRKSSNARSASTRSFVRKKEEPKKGFLAGLFDREEESPKRIETVNDFLRQPSVPFE